MSPNTELALLTASATLFAWVAPASATVLVATYTGTISSGYDYTAVFGSVGDLTGDTFVVQYTYDTSVGSRTTDLPSSDEVYGGSIYGVPSPISATLTVDGHTASSNGDLNGFALTNPSSDIVDEYARQSYTIPMGYAENTIYSYGYGTYQPNLDTAVPLTTISAGGGNAQFYDEIGGVFTPSAYANLTVNTVQISSAVPEPTAWVVMLVGLGALGVGMRARRREAARA